MTRKAYSLPQSVTGDITNSLNIVKNNSGSLNYRIVPLDIIEFDPDNPRDLCITREDVISGLQVSDPLYEIKQKELESLHEMAETVKRVGVRNAVEIYKFGTKYRLIHGERRCLSSLLAGKSDIPAKVLDEKPNNFDIKLLQLIENVQREDLNLSEFINNIRMVIDEYKKNVDSSVVIDASFLETLINKSRSQCFHVLSVLNAPSDIQIFVEEGKIRSLEKAALIANEKDTQQRQVLLEACITGASLQELKQAKQYSKNIQNIEPIKLQPKQKPGKRASKINMGETKNRGVVAKLIKLVLQDPTYSKWSEELKKLSFNDYDSCSVAFKQLIALMEKHESA